MKKSEIKNLTNRQLLVEYISSYSLYDTNFVLRRGTDKISKHLKDLEEELIKREILLEEDIRILNM